MKTSLMRLTKEECKLEMTSMIDVTFLLLIFFMCTLKFKTLEGKLSAYLPKDVGVNQMDAEPIEKVEILIKVVREGTRYHPRGPAYGLWKPEVNVRWAYGDDRVLEYAIGPRKTRDLEELRSRLKLLHQADVNRPATIDARKGVVYEDVIRVLDQVMALKFKECTFVGSYE